jgi:hypothetical protein
MSESTEYYNININSDNIIELELLMGLYTIDKLIEVTNQALNEYNIEISYSTTTNLIIIKSTNNTQFNIILNEGTLFYNLGFSQNLSNSLKYISTKIFDLKPPRYLNVYLSNINNTKVIMQLTSTNQSKKITFNNPIKLLSNIEFRITDHLDKNYIIDNLSTTIELVVRSINNIKSISIENESITISSDDMYSIIKSNISN